MEEYAEGTAHASVRTYGVVLLILAVVTFVEVATYFMPWFQARPTVLFWSLTLMSLAKFGLVVGYYMHLRFDARYYRRVFIVPLAIAVAMTVVVATLTVLRFAG